MKRIFKNKIFKLIGAIILLVVAYFIDKNSFETPHETVVKVEKALHNKEYSLEKEMQFLAEQVENKSFYQLFEQQPTYYQQLFEKDGLALLIYENDTLKFWSDNSIAVENWIKEVCLDTKMVKLKNGWFRVMKPQTNSRSTKAIIGLILVKNEYPYQNKYLTNEFQEDYLIEAEKKIVIDSTSALSSIRDYKGNYLFSLELGNFENYFSYWVLVSILFYLISMILILQVVNESITLFIFRTNKIAAFFFLLLIITAVRYLSLRYSWPSVLYHFEIFKPLIYADSSSIWLSSLGDLLINSFLFFYFSYKFYNNFEIEKLLGIKLANNFIYSFLSISLYFLLFKKVTYVIEGLVKNSSISFNINNIFSLTCYSYIAFVVIGIVLLGCFLIANKITSTISNFKFGRKIVYLLFISTVVFLFFVNQFFEISDLFILDFPLILIVFLFLVKVNKKEISFSTAIFLVLLFTFFTVYILIRQTNLKELVNRSIYVEKIADEQDPIAELLFQDVDNKIGSDSILSLYVSGQEKQISEFEKRIKQFYFSGYWEKYDVKIALFDSLCSPIIKTSNNSFDNNSYFDDLIKTKGTPTSCEHFNFLKNASGKISYIAKLPLYKYGGIKIKLGTLYIELDAKYIADEIGFPELLLDRNIGLTKAIEDYSYAKYKKHQLITQFGKFSYDSDDKIFRNNKFRSQNFDFENYNHLVYKLDEQTIIVLSKKKGGLLFAVTTFSYVFAFFSLLLLVVLILNQIAEGVFLRNHNFKFRIQMVFVTILLLSLALFGGGTIYYIKQQFETKNKDNINEKIQSILLDLESKFSSESQLKKGLADYTTFLLKKSSNIFFTDINLYDLAGNLYSSSRAKVFEEGLTSKKINPTAYLQMAVLGKSSFVHDERIGKLNYLSAYVPLRNKDNIILAYLNLPYFAKQSELEKEIATFLVAVINIYVLLFALSIISALLISSYVARPLKLIQEKLSQIKLGKTNETIEWKENDEIGSLVEEYNRMILELAKSADLLAKSERESAWQEMAKQVAHEIKNPLTPMKLSVQHLQRIWKDRAPDKDEKIDSLTHTIIEQIDTLSNIANEFSNFAKMPKPNFQKVDLITVLVNSILLYNDSQNFSIEFQNKTDQENLFVQADKEQLLRAFSNLIKNAIQSIPDDRVGQIMVVLKTQHKKIQLEISDNGIGINDEFLEKIFTPNFTTKTGGMGLGLAMVKNIIEGFEGRIWFETKQNMGTTFYITLPFNED